MSGILYMLPNVLSEDSIERSIPNAVKEKLCSLKYFIVENVKTTRRYLKKIDRSINIDELTFFTLNKHTDAKEISDFLSPAKSGNDIGLISEAGVPGVADPGAVIAKIAHQNNIKVVPMVGPSSILLALMASGMNGQSFTFHGYLPINRNERINEIKKLETNAKRFDQTQIFIETPFRNNQMLEDIIKSCHPNTKLCLASNITAKNEFIITKTIAEWKGRAPDINKQPTVFLIYKA